MTHNSLALFVLFATVGAAPGPTPSLPVPPIPPAHPPTGQLAPVPNPELRGTQDPVSRGTQGKYHRFRVPNRTRAWATLPAHTSSQAASDEISILLG